VNEEAVNTMYAIAQGEGYNGSIEDFTQLLIDDQRALGTMYTLALENGYEDSLPDFEVLMGVKKKDVVTEPVSEAGLSEQQRATRDPAGEGLRTIGQQFSPGGVGHPVPSPRRDVHNLLPYEMPAEVAARDSVMDLYDTRAAAALEEEAKRRELEAIEISRNLPTVEIPEGERSSVLAELNATYGRFGFQFQESYKPVGVGLETLDAVKVFANAPDGTTVELELQLDEDGNIPPSEANKLDPFIRQNAERIPTVDETLAQQATRVHQMRDIPRVDGNEVSTVKMAWGDVDGKFVAYPTLFPANPAGAESSSPEDWLELEGFAALDEAMKRNEVFYFDTEKEAKEFADGNWKTIDPQDLTFEKMWSDMGRNYWADQEFLKELDERRDEFLFLEALPEYGTRYEKDKFGFPVDEIPEEYKQYFIDGNMVRDDIDAIIDKKRSELQGLEDRFDRDNVLLDLKEKRDVMLSERFKELSETAAEANREAQAAQNFLEARALTQFGVRLEDLGDYEPKSNGEVFDMIRLYGDYNKTVKQKQFAALTYERAQTFYDKQHDKALTDGYVDGWEEVTVALSNGVKRGNAMSRLLLIQMGYYDVIGDPEGEKEAMLEVAEIMDSIDPRTGRVVSRANATGTSDSFIQSISRNPGLYTMAITAESLGQLAPLWYNGS